MKLDLKLRLYYKPDCFLLYIGMTPLSKRFDDLEKSSLQGAAEKNRSGSEEQHHRQGNAVIALGDTAQPATGHHGETDRQPDRRADEKSANECQAVDYEFFCLLVHIERRVSCSHS